MIFRSGDIYVGTEGAKQSLQGSGVDELLNSFE